MFASVTGDGLVNIWDMSISTLDPIVSDKRVDPVDRPHPPCCCLALSAYHAAIRRLLSPPLAVLSVC